MLSFTTKRTFQSISTLDAFLHAHTKWVVMQRVLGDPIMTDVVANSTTCSKDTLAQRDLMYGLVQFVGRSESCQDFVLNGNKTCHFDDPYEQEFYILSQT